MGILSWIFFGLIVGILAKLLMPGKGLGGIIVTILIGIAGSFIGGFISSFLGFGSPSGINFKSILISVGGAVLLLGGYRLIKKR